MSIELINLHMIRCDHCPPGMGNDAYWQSDDDPMLFDSVGQALDCLRTELLKNEGWTTDGEHHHCESCSKLFPLVDPNPAPEPVPVLPGQIPLGGES